MIRRHTIQCALVLEAVNRLKCHATAEDIYEELAREHSNISRGTIYRNLQRLSEDGEILRLEIPGGADRFDHNCQAHEHVRCVKCGRVEDVDMAPLTGLEKSVTDARGFTLNGYDIIFKGVCPECGADTPEHPQTETPKTNFKGE